MRKALFIALMMALPMKAQALSIASDMFCDKAADCTAVENLCMQDWTLVNKTFESRKRAQLVEARKAVKCKPKDMPSLPTLDCVENICAIAGAPKPELPSAALMPVWDVTWYGCKADADCTTVKRACGGWEGANKTYKHFLDARREKELEMKVQCLFIEETSAEPPPVKCVDALCKVVK